MPTKRLIKVRSQFEDGFLKSFELISVTPEFDRFVGFTAKHIRAALGYVKIFDNVLWIDTDIQQNAKYHISRGMNRDTYNRYMKGWNEEPDITVIDVNKNYIGEL